MTTENKSKNMEVDIRKLLSACLSKWWLIALFAIVAAVATWLFTVNMITPLYRSKITIYVQNASNYETVHSISSSNLEASQQLVNTYIGIIRTDKVLEQVADKLEEQTGRQLTVGQIRNCLSAKQIEETILFEVMVTHADPQIALDIAKAMEEVVPTQLKEIVQGSTPTVVDAPKKATSPFSPNVRRNCLLGAVVGCLLAAVLIVLTHLLDVRIKNEEDLEAFFDYPVLGQVPAFTNEEEKSEEGLAKPGKRTNAKKGGRA